MSKMAILNQLPPPPEGKIGFPWTDEGTPQYMACNDIPKIGKDENLPKISIITPSFNQGQFIEETIRSVLLQGYPNLEYIIIDGGSTDNTLEIIEKYCDFIHYWISEKDKGQSDAINKGLKQATGTVFNWLNSDDFYVPNALFTVGKAFENKELNVFCAQQYVDTIDGKRLHLAGVRRKETIEANLVDRYFNQSPTFFRLSIVKELGGVATDFFSCMDLELWVNYIAHFGHKGIVENADFLAVLRIHPQAKSSNAKKINYSDCFNLLFALVNSSDLKDDFPKRFLNDNAIFTIYFAKKYPLSITDEKRLLALISQQILELYSQFMSWQSFFELYFYALKQLPNNRNKRFYLLPFIKIKRLFKPISF
jgi:glycosyltransferase involved in cell wall biosynthesis